jgi:hypothetical protein
MESVLNCRAGPIGPLEIVGVNEKEKKNHSIYEPKLTNLTPNSRSGKKHLILWTHQLRYLICLTLWIALAAAHAA